MNVVAPLKVAVVAGEVSGDLLGADLIAALKRLTDRPVSLVGVGGEGLQAEGLTSLFDYSELSIMGLSQVLARLPKLIVRIRQTARAIIEARPDVLLIIDSPDFTHRVARIVRKVLPALPIVNYVCPSVWAWKPERAPRMRAYVDHVLAVLPFEPEAMRALGGPPTTYVGHRLVRDPDLMTARTARLDSDASRRPPSGLPFDPVCLLLPGSRGSEIRRLLPVFGEAAAELSARHPNIRFLLPTVPRQAALVREIVADWAIQPDISTDRAAKWQAFATADAAFAASGTVILELGLTGVPVVLAYKADWLIRLMHNRIRIWSAALPNIIADRPIVPEYLNEAVRPGTLTRWFECLAADTPQRVAMADGFAEVWNRMAVDAPPGEKAAAIVLRLAKGT